MNERYLYALCGAVGALLYAFPAFLASIRATPPIKFAWLSLSFSVSIGLVGAPILVPMLGHIWPFLVVPEPYPLAAAIGLAINPLAPIFVRKATGWADSYQVGPNGTKSD